MPPSSLTKIRRQWFAKRKSVAAILKEVMTNEASALLDTDAHNKAMDADAALQELGSDQIGQAFVTATVTVWDGDPGAPPTKSCAWSRRSSRAAISPAWSRRSTRSRPGSAACRDMSTPMCGSRRSRRSNLAHMIPLSAVWAGEARDQHFKAPPLFLAKTEGSTPFRFSLHVGDVGHTLVVGPTGAGKSVLLALMALQFRRYPELPDLRVRFRWFGPRRHARHGWRLA